MRNWVGLVVMAFVSSISMANFADDAGTFTGGGEWKTPDGTKGKWTATMTVTKGEKGAVVTEKLTIVDPKGEKHVEEMESTMVVGKEGFFDILSKEKKIGFGVCWGMSCQMSGDSKDANGYSETMHFDKKKGVIYRMGHDMHEGMPVAWVGTMKKQD